MMISSTCLFVMFHTEDMNLTYLVVDDAGIFGLDFQSKRKVSVLMFFKTRMFSSPILGGGFKYCLLSPRKLGKMNPF